MDVFLKARVGSFGNADLDVLFLARLFSHSRVRAPDMWGLKDVAHALDSDYMPISDLASSALRHNLLPEHMKRQGFHQVGRERPG